VFENTETEFSVALTGDGVLERSLPRASKCMRAIRDLLHRADITLLNLEVPLTASGWPLPKDVARGDPGLAGELRWLGIVGVTLGNNHAMDYGAEGLAEMLRALKGAGLAHTGAGENLDAAVQPMVLSVRNVRVAVVSFLCWAFRPEIPDYSHVIRAWPNWPGVATIDVYEVRVPGGEQEASSLRLPVEEDLRVLEAAVRAARRDADLVIASLHANWGDSTVHSTSLTLHPIQIHRDGPLASLPELARGRRGREILTRVAGLSARLGTHVEIASDGTARVTAGG